MSETQTRTLITAAEAAGTPPSPGRLSALLLEHGTMQLRWFAPKGEDTQTPHDQDELYIIASGTGCFAVGRNVCPSARMTRYLCARGRCIGLRKPQPTSRPG